jgi:hypothetical protein
VRVLDIVKPAVSGPQLVIRRDKNPQQGTASALDKVSQADDMASFFVIVVDCSTPDALS